MTRARDALAKTITANIMTELRPMFDEIGLKFKHVDRRFEQIDERFDQVDKRLEQVNDRLDQVDTRFKQIDERFDQVDCKIENLRSDMDDQFHLVRVELEQTNLKIQMCYDISSRILEIGEQVRVLAEKVSKNDTRITLVELGVRRLSKEKHGGN